MLSVSVFGIGYTGTVSAACLAEQGHRVIAVDIDRDKVEAVNAGRTPIVEERLDALVSANHNAGRLSATTDIAEAVLSTDVSIVCVGTPSEASGAIGLSYVTALCRSIGQVLAEKKGSHSVIMRSTLVPGTMEGVCVPELEKASGLKAGTDFGVGYFPEFLREGTAVADYFDPCLIVYGAMDEATMTALRDLNADLPGKHHAVDMKTAEMIKYTSNSWRAAKITFANEIGNIAKSVGVDGQAVMKILCSDDKVAMTPYFLRPGFAFGGSCLPKDLRALRFLANSNAVAAPLLEGVLAANENQIARAETLVKSFEGRTVGMVGISFKPGTDDLRESPLAALASRLIDSGYEVRIYDPSVKEAYDEGMSGAGRGNDKVADLPSLLIGDLAELTALSDIIVVGHRYKEVVEPLSALIGQKPIVDLARLSPNAVSEGLYEGICW
ncbi:nucleotide sugar dehydrogenase [Martelella limonii]|uniref:nucleotide sugar dehydrogenase n=1 Tax=Martelella limonii TaxID=1647649 RepID=UPI001580E42F